MLQRTVIYERSESIPITQISPTSATEKFSKKEYGLKRGFFDPENSSPPNEFMMKLHMRNQIYNSLSLRIKEESTASE